MKAAAVVLAGLLAAACSFSPLYYASDQERSVPLAPGELEAGGLAFITPSTVTGQEQEKQAVALVLGAKLP